ncbi:DNA-binding transcriptional regulator, GntR family [Paracoccus aminovorans]|uniref:DNA-binding transcriptional regulator, GntR family n=1 Tax=Paracoccus aminovorans TaxID=34004 RepID=A0A1I3B3N8_9RHOB|nr:GntR family transcriptional regulator [Paracoccus aminovorans]CQR87564.1 transcriptional regulator, GntR family protein [Paracoccus aminovorans]SFH56903.1 DNA-binding transcriptional regulator, GntR family [Paracoccus aminovorans]
MATAEQRQDEETRGKRGRPKGQATQAVYSALRGEILTLTLKPGQYLEEVALEKRFGVSRTPIREALIRLQTDRLVRFSPNRGHYVEPVSFEDVPRIFEALDLQQTGVLQLAASRWEGRHLDELHRINEAYRDAGEANDHKAMAELNHEFHLMTAQAAGNSFLAEFYETMLNFSIRLSYLMFQSASRNREDFEGYYTQVYREHVEMIELIRQGDVRRLQEISQQHIRLFSDRVVSFLIQRTEIDASVQDFRSAVEHDADDSSPATGKIRTRPRRA